jgi:hypothetical protein
MGRTDGADKSGIAARLGKIRSKADTKVVGWTAKDDAPVTDNPGPPEEPTRHGGKGPSRKTNAVRALCRPWG